jgi:hypothetical protein
MLFAGAADTGGIAHEKPHALFVGMRLWLQGSYAELYEELAGEPVLELHHQPHIASKFNRAGTYDERCHSPT